MVEGEVRECVAELQRALAPGEWRDALGLLLALARNVASEPENPRFRRINVSDTEFHERVWRHGAAQLLMGALGWVETEDNTALVLPQESTAMVDAVPILEMAAPPLARPAPEGPQSAWLVFEDDIQQGTQFFSQGLFEQAVQKLSGPVQALPHDETWARCAGILANSLRQQRTGNKQSHMESVIRLFEATLEVFRRETHPAEWAAAHTNLGEAFRERLAGDQSANVEMAIMHHLAALEVHTREDAPPNWATSQMNLGVAFVSRRAGEREQNVERAIAHFEAALKVFTREVSPHNWATTRMNLATAFRNRPAGERKENIDTAIGHYQAALEVRTRESNPHKWAATQANLGNAFFDRLTGERKENIEMSIRHFEAALEVFTREIAPHDWAKIQNNLGSAFLTRLAGQRKDNIEAAIRHFEAALQVHTRETAPHFWAMRQMNMGNAYQNRLAGERMENVEIAIEHFQKALQVYSREATPRDWAMVQVNLGDSFRNRLAGQRYENIQMAIQQYELALTTFTPLSDPHRWAGTQEKLATALEKHGVLHSSIDCFRAALTVFTPAAAPRSHANASCGLGRVLFASNQPAEAFAAAQSALAALEDERLVARAVSDDFDAKSKITADMADAVAVMVQCLLHPSLNRPTEALELLEAQHARGLADLAHAPSLDSVNEDAPFRDERLAWLAARQEAQRLHRELENAENGASGAETSDLLRQLREQVQRAVQNAHELQAALSAVDTSFQSIQSIQPLTYPEMQALLSPTTVAAVWFTVDIISGVVVFSRATPQPRFMLYKSGQVEAIIQRLGALIKARSDANAGLQLLFEDLADALQLQKVHDELLQCRDVLCSALDHASLLLIPRTIFQQAPLDSLPLSHNGRTLADVFAGGVLHAPSLALLKQAQRLPAPSSLALRHDAFVAVQNPTFNLLGADEEVGMIERMLLGGEGTAAAMILQHGKATPTALRVILERARTRPFVLHVACHGKFDPDARWKSGLLLAPESAGQPHSILTVSDVMDLSLRNCHLCVLSACESGLLDGRDTEAVGLTSALLVAGVRRVVSTLWRVSDTATVLLIGRMYRHLIESGGRESLTSALHRAREWLRNLTKDQAVAELGAINPQLRDRFVAELQRHLARASGSHFVASTAQTTTTAPGDTRAALFHQADWDALCDALDGAVPRLELIQFTPFIDAVCPPFRIFKFRFMVGERPVYVMLRVVFSHTTRSEDEQTAALHQLTARFATAAECDQELFFEPIHAVFQSFCANACDPEAEDDGTTLMMYGDGTAPPWAWRTDPDRRMAQDEACGEVPEGLRARYEASGTLTRFAQAHRLLHFTFDRLARVTFARTADELARPFASPRYWAAFIVSGDGLAASLGPD